MNGQVLELHVHHQAEEQAEDADDHAAEEQAIAAHAQELHAPEIRQNEVRLGTMLGRVTGAFRNVCGDSGVARGMGFCRHGLTERAEREDPDQRDQEHAHVPVLH